MPTNPNKLSQFWQELKRRKVVRVITVYAAAAFVILELVDIIAEPLKLPEWFLSAVIVILCIGFIIAVILSWIYDIHPEGGIVKTKPTHKVKAEDVPKSSNSWKIASYISFVVIVGLIIFHTVGERKQVEVIKEIEKSIAVLPFEDMSPNKDQEYFCDGMAEEIINALAHIEGLKVIARTSSFAFKGKHEDIREIGKKLDVETLLEGSIRKDGDQLRITAQLIKVSDGSHLWSERYDRDLEDIFDIQDEISLAITDNLKVKLLGEEKTAIEKRYTEDLEAYNLYLQGNYYLNKLTSEGYQKAIEHYEQALSKDQNFLLAYFGLARVYHHSSLGAKAIEYANKTLEIDNTFSGAYLLLGDVSMLHYWDWESAERYFKQALQLNPNKASILSDYSILLSYTGRNEEAIATALRAQKLSPLETWVNFSVGSAYFCDQQYDRAIEVLEMTLARDPNIMFNSFLLGMVYQAKSMMEEAITTYKKWVDYSGGETLSTAFLAMAYYESGERVKADELFEIIMQRSKDEDVSPSALYLIYKARGELDLAYKWFERAVNQHDLWLLPLIFSPIERDSFPDEPRYNALLKKVGLEK